jgi:hypothetical protein
MGRPKLPGEHPAIQIQLPREFIERIDAVMGMKGRRGLFFRSATERELRRLEAIKRQIDRDAALTPESPDQDE